MGFPDVSATILAVYVSVIMLLTFSLSNSTHYTAQITTETFLFSKAESCFKNLLFNNLFPLLWDKIFFLLFKLTQCTCWWKSWETVSLYLVTDRSAAPQIITRFWTMELKNSLSMCFLERTDGTGTMFLPLFLNILFNEWLYRKITSHIWLHKSWETITLSLLIKTLWCRTPTQLHLIFSYRLNPFFSPLFENNLTILFL